MSMHITHGYRYADGRALCPRCAAEVHTRHAAIIISEFICDECLEPA